MNTPFFDPGLAGNLLDVLDSAPDGVMITDQTGRIVYANPQLLSIFGYTSDEILAQPIEFLVPERLRARHVDQRSAHPAHFRTHAMATGLQTVGRRRDGAEIHLNIRLHSIVDGGQRSTVAFVTDRTADVLKTLELKRLNRALRLVHDCNETLVRATGETELLNGVAAQMVELGEYPLVWVGLCADAAASELDVAVSAGIHPECLKHCTPLERGAGIGGAAIRSGQPRVVRNVDQNTAEHPFCAHNAACRFPASVALPFAAGENVRGCLCVGSNNADAFNGDEIGLLQELVDDLAYGLATLRSRATRRNAEGRLRLLERAIEASVNAVMITDAVDAKHAIIYVNAAFEQITGCLAAEAVGRNGRFLVGDELAQAGLTEIRAALREKRTGQAPLKIFHKDGGVRWVELTVAPVRDDAGNVSHFVSVMNDTTERQRQEEQIARHARYDRLTGLPNRALLFERIALAIANGEEQGRSLGIVIVAIDRFTMFNDAFGHDVGDLLLKLIGERMQIAVRRGDTVARIGGDEFVAVLADLSAADDVVQVVDKVHAVFADPFALPGGGVVVSASIGVSLYPRDGGDAQALLSNAEAAMRGAKSAGSNAVRFYAEDMNRRTGERLDLEQHLRQALNNGEFELFYQPIVDVNSARIVEAEALLRWHHPTRGMVPPNEFIPMAETTGLIGPIGEWVVREACRQNAAWRRSGLEPIAVGVNLSARQLREPGLEELVAKALDDSGLDGSALILEVTESMLMEDIEKTASTLSKLKALGIHIALDDFGTGYSSLAYLKRLPLDTLKIDRSFVRDISTDANDAAIVVTVISMARALDLGVVAEGVETQAQLGYLRARGCRLIQGFWFSPPVPAAQFEAMLRDDDHFRAAAADATAQPALLLVDDEPSIAAAIKRLLRRDGYPILIANSAAEGLDLLARHTVAVIVSDQRMPVMTGTEFLKRVKTMYPETIRIVLSGYTDLRSVTEAVNQGAVYKFITKPWDDDELRRTIREAFQRYAGTGEGAASRGEQSATS